MKSSDIDEAERKTGASAEIQEKPLYAIIAVLIPCSAMLSLLPLLGYFLSALVALVAGREIQALPSLSYAAWFTAAFLSGFAASGYGALIKKFKNDHATADIRGGIVILILTYGLTSLFNFSRPLGARLFPSVISIPATAASFAVWFIVLAVKRVFAARELFESHAAHYTGEKLRQVMLEDAILMSAADDGIAKIVRFYTVHYVIAAVLIFACGGLGVRLSLPFIILLIVLLPADFALWAFWEF
jgi:hypothetical protein